MIIKGQTSENFSLINSLFIVNILIFISTIVSLFGQRIGRDKLTIVKANKKMLKQKTLKCYGGGGGR